MARHIVGLLILSLGLLAGACSDQSALGPSGDHPSFKPASTSPDTGATGTGGKGGPGGSAGGFKK
jgi:hypothetical protein